MKKLFIILALLVSTSVNAQWHQWSVSEETDLRTLNEATFEVAVLTERVANDYRVDINSMSRQEMFTGLESCWLAVEKMNDALTIFTHGNPSSTISTAYTYIDQALNKANNCRTSLELAGSDELGVVDNIISMIQSVNTSDTTRFSVWWPTTYPDFPLCPFGYDDCNNLMNRRVDSGPIMALQGMYDIASFYDPIAAPNFSAESAQQVYESLAREKLFIREIIRARAALMGAPLTGDDPLTIHSRLALERSGLLQQPETGKNSLWTALIADNGNAWAGEHLWWRGCKQMGSCGSGRLRIAEWEADHVQWSEAWPIFGYFSSSPAPEPNTCPEYVPSMDVIVNGIPVTCELQ